MKLGFKRLAVNVVTAIAASSVIPSVSAAEEAYSYKDPFGKVVSSRTVSRSSLEQQGYTAVFCDHATTHLNPFKDKSIIRGNSPKKVKISRQKRKDYETFNCRFTANKNYESVQIVLGLNGKGSNKLLVIFNSGTKCLQNNDLNFWNRDLDRDNPAAFVEGPVHRKDIETLKRAGCMALG